MEQGAVLSRLRAAASAAKPGLRVIGLAYTGLGGMLALTLVVSVALVPVGPAIQQVAEPARQVVSNLVQPTSDAVTVFFGGVPSLAVDARASVVAPTRVSAFSDAVSLDVTIEDPIEATPVDERIAVVFAPPMRAPAAEVESPSPEAVDEIVGLEPIEVRAPHAVEPVVVLPAPTAGLQIASNDPPKALPTMPAPTETALQVKARLDVENQTAIDAAKAAQVRAKAEADAANNAAIAARKAAATVTASVQDTPVSVSAPVTAKVSADVTPAVATKVANTAPPVKSGDSATPTAMPQSKAAANAANQAAIDAAKAAQARAKAEANAANQAAQAAKSGKSSAKATPTATAQPTPAAAPTAQPTSAANIEAVAGVTAEGQANVVGGNPVDPQGNVKVDVVELQVGEVYLENVPVDQAEMFSDAGAA